MVLALLSAFLLPATASAQTTEQQDRAAELLLENRQEYVLNRKPYEASEESFPERFDLRDQGYVTPVKLQNPWGTCWGFSAIAAAETSILSKLGKTYEETGLDLSEHHLAWFARTHLEDENLSQNSEGVYLFDDSKHLNTGGIMFTATSLFSSGIGVVSEDTIPYRGKDSKTYSGILENFWYSEEDDWSIPAEYEFLQSFELENSDLLL